MSEDYLNGDFLADFDVDAAVVAFKANSDKHDKQNNDNAQDCHEQPQPQPQPQPPKKSKISAVPSVHGTNDYPMQMTSQSNSQKRSQLAITNPTRKKQALTLNCYKRDEQKINEKSTIETMKSKLTQTLQVYFGHNTYRSGQLSVIQSILNGQDAAVFWSTGAGKSICYQIPPLHTRQIAIVISPLISLMEDQVSKLNGLGIGGNHGHTAGKDIAIFLGSRQTDPMAQQRVLNGDYRIVYCTPEKLTHAGGSFLNDLGDMHRRGQQTTSTMSGGKSHNRICLVAVDESHCVSEWGHDFRPTYRSIGKDLRSHPILRDIPLLALTATAMPRVQTDIISSLHMVNPNISQQSFDRHNLIISVKRKPPGGYMTALKPFVNDLKNSAIERRQAKESTIVYCQTTNLVDEVSSWLSSQLKESSIRVEAYHGGLSSDKRTKAHIDFLTGKTVVIVATIAFGMGIDKPDTRRIIHYGPPKTVEEYYQQIGRAGRDGIEAYCTMYCNFNDFESFKGDFYLGALSAAVKQAQIKSIDSLRRFAMSDDTCRRACLLKFFGEEPGFGASCGTCDICKNKELHSDDLKRDFANAGARVVLYALSVLNGKQGVGVIESILKGKKVEAYRYRNGSVDPDAEMKVVSMKAEMKGLKMKKKMPTHYYSKDLLLALVNKKFVYTKSFSSNISQRSVTWSGYDLTEKGWSKLRQNDEPIILPVPPSIRELEKKLEEDTKKSLIDLKASGADVDQIPQKEIDEGDGQVMRSLKTWYGYLDLLRRNEKLDRIDQLDDLKLQIEAWRSDTAVQYRMAPSDVMPEHLVVKVAYAVASLGNGARVEKKALLSIGLRSGGVDALVDVLESWMKETNEPHNGDVTSTSLNHCNAKMIFKNEAFQPLIAWEHASHKRNKKTGLYAWESSYQRFVAGEHPQTIAMTPVNGRPIQVPTVVGHILDGLVMGRPVDLNRLTDFGHIPTKYEWDKLCQAEAETGIDVTGDPTTSGAGGETLRMSDLLVPIFGNTFFSKEYKERSEPERAKYSYWCNVVKWYMALRRVGYIPQFQEDAQKKEGDLQASV